MNDIVITDLTTLADRINTEHQAAENHARQAIQHAINAGNLLIEAKAQCQHGQWLPWLKVSVSFSERTARSYMQLARELSALDDGKRQRVADLPLREALKALAASDDNPMEHPDSHPNPQHKKPFLSGDKEGIAKTVRTWLDLLGGYAVLLETAGCSVPEIAGQLGVTEREVMQNLYPAPLRLGANWGAAEIADLYQYELNSIMAFDSWRSYSIAAQNAVREGYSALEPKLAQLRDIHEEKYIRYLKEIARLKRRVEFDSAHVVWCAAKYDFRAAIGLELPIKSETMHLCQLIELFEEIETYDEMDYLQATDNVRNYDSESVDSVN